MSLNFKNKNKNKKTNFLINITFFTTNSVAKIV